MIYRLHLKYDGLSLQNPERSKHRTLDSTLTTEKLTYHIHNRLLVFTVVLYHEWTFNMQKPSKNKSQKVHHFCSVENLTHLVQSVKT